MEKYYKVRSYPLAESLWFKRTRLEQTIVKKQDLGKTLSNLYFKKKYSVHVKLMNKFCRIMPTFIFWF